MEEYLHFTPADGLDAETLFATIKETFSKCNIDHTACIDQCYDGMAVMSGVHNRVQEKFREEIPQASTFIATLPSQSCFGGLCQKPAGDFFVIVQDMYKFFSGSFVHAHFIMKQRELQPSQQPIKLKKLSDT